MKKLLFLGACLVALASQPVMAQTSGPDVVVVKFYYKTPTRLHVAIARSTGKPEEQEIKGNDVEEAQFCQQILAKLYQEGYSVKTSLALGTTNSSTVVLTKEK